MSAAIISASAALLGALIGGAATYEVARRAEQGRRQDELTAAATALLVAMDLLRIELKQLPRATRSSRRINQFLETRLPSVNFGLGAMARFTVIRPGERALQRFLDAANRLALIAPTSLVLEVGEAAKLLESWDDQDPTEWAEAWNTAKSRLVILARAAGGID